MCDCEEHREEELCVFWRGYTTAPGTPANYKGVAAGEQIPAQPKNATHLEVIFASVPIAVGRITLTGPTGVVILDVDTATAVVAGAKLRVDVRDAAQVTIATPTGVSLIFRWLRVP